MLYTAGEIIWWMVLAAAVGLALGWLVRGLSLRGRLEAGFERDISSRQLRINTLEENLRDLQGRLEATQDELQAAQARLEDERAASVTVRARLDEAEAAASDLAARVEALTDELEAARRDAPLPEPAPLEARVDELTVALAAKDRQLAEIESARSSSQAGELAQLERELAAARADAEAERRRAEAAAAELARLRQAVSATEQPSTPAGATESPVEPAPAGTGLQDPVDEIEALASRTRGSEPEVVDDLQRIHGIGPKIEQTLIGLGITSYRQIARLTDDDIDMLGDHLGRFRDRIRRDDWMGSAAELHRQVYGSEL